MMKIGVDTASAVRTVNNYGKIFDKERLLKTIGVAFLHWVDENFKVQGKEKKWRKLSENTKLSRRKGSSNVLQDTGRMKQSIKPTVSGNEVFIGTADKRAIWHHYGTKPYFIFPKALGLHAVMRPSRTPRRGGFDIESFGRKALRFKVAYSSKAGNDPAPESGGEFVFAQKVHHPGLAARSLFPSDGVAQDLAERTVEAYVEKMIGTA